jgi:hypothetical protein
MYGLFLVALILSNRAPPELVAPTQAGTFATENECIQAAKGSDYATGASETNFPLAGQFICVKQR